MDCIFCGNDVDDEYLGICQKCLDEMSHEPDRCTMCGEYIKNGRARQDEDENIICEDCFMELQAKKLNRDN